MPSLAELQIDLAALKAAKMRLLTSRMTTTVETSTPVGRSTKTSQAVSLPDLNREILILKSRIAMLTGGPGALRPLQVR